MADDAGTSGREVYFAGTPAEEKFGYAQAVRVGNTIHVSGQLGWDENGTLLDPAPLGADGRPSDSSVMEAQMRATYASAGRVLGRFGASLADVVSETLFTLDVDAVFAVGRQVRQEAYGEQMPRVASNIMGISRLAFPEQLLEITFIAVLPD